jgi:membrane-bound lytic murein transglycosylase B
VNQAKPDLVQIERQRLELERRRAEAETEERERRRQEEEKIRQVRRFLAETISAFEDLKQRYP